MFTEGHTEMRLKAVSGAMLTLLIGIFFISALSSAYSVQLTGNPHYYATYSGQSTVVSGLISENTTWTLAGSPYIIVGNVIVDWGVFLKIEPGIVVKFTSGTNLLIDGGLIAQGNSTHKITFTSNVTTPAPGDWAGILIRSSGYCNMADSIIEYATTGIHFESYEEETARIFNYSRVTSNIVGLKVSGGWWNAYSTGLTIEGNLDCGIYVNGFLVINNSLISNNSIGVNVQGPAYLDLANSTISHNTLDGVHGSPYHMMSIHDSDIVDNGGKGIHGEGYWLRCSNSRISNNSGDGIFSGYYQELSVAQCNITNNDGHGVFSSYDVILSGSIVSNNSINGVSGENVDVEFSTIMDNGNVGVSASGGKLNFNNIHNNGTYELGNTGSNDINATHNWWGTTNGTLIEERIHDYWDDFNLGRVLHEPYLVAPVESYPVSLFIYGPSEPFVNETVTFDASDSYDSDGSIVSYSWDFGDDTNATEAEPITNHAYTNAGMFTVTLNVTDNDGLTNIIPVDLDVNIIPEFSSPLILSLFTVFTMLAIVFVKKKKIL